MRKGFIVAPLAALCLLPQTVAHAWDATAHMIVAQIAYSRLNAHAKAEVDRLIGISVTPTSALSQTNTFVTAACWADDIKSSTSQYSSQHYIDVPFSTDGTTTVPAATPNVQTAIPAAIATLKSTTASDASKATALRLLIHFVGDVHQPLHSANRFSHSHPSGDRGGNDFAIRGVSSSELHAYWDGGVELYTQTFSRPLSSSSQTQLKSFAATVTAAYPDTSVPEWKTSDVSVWVSESFNSAKNVAYNLVENSTPSSAYKTTGKSLVNKRLALAGYRLADVLNTLYP
jgi:hypothetical protein